MKMVVILKSYGTSYRVPQEADTSLRVSGFSYESSICIPEFGEATDTEIGQWKFRATATDNEGESDTEEVSIIVKNMDPILIVEPKPDKIYAGYRLIIDNSNSYNPDGGELTFQ
jgi:hypothetical protein